MAELSKSRFFASTSNGIVVPEEDESIRPRTYRTRLELWISSRSWRNAIDKLLRNSTRLRPTADSRDAAVVQEASAIPMMPTIITASKISVSVNPFLFFIK